MSQVSILLRLAVIQPPPQPGLPASNAPDKKFNSRLVAPTVLGIEPFGENVERLSLSVTRLVSLTVRFKQIESSISRRVVLFEPSHKSAARCDQSNCLTAVSACDILPSFGITIDENQFAEDSAHFVLRRRIRASEW